MKFTEIQIEKLIKEVRNSLSPKRFQHTLGVEKMAVILGGKIMPDDVDKLRVAALLHDISKEYSEAEYFSVVEKHKITFTEEDIASPALWHSITAPEVVKDDFPEYADADVLSAVYNHTVGSPDMTVFDEIILVSDYIEEGRTYKNCIDVRERLLLNLRTEKKYEEFVTALHEATVSALNNTINDFVSRGKSFHSRTKATHDAILAKTERRNNGN